MPLSLSANYDLETGGKFGGRYIAAWLIVSIEGGESASDLPEGQPPNYFATGTQRHVGAEVKFKNNPSDIQISKIER